jgi:hypothetical protein
LFGQRFCFWDCRIEVPHFKHVPGDAIARDKLENTVEDIFVDVSFFAGQMKIATIHSCAFWLVGALFGFIDIGMVLELLEGDYNW